MLLIDESLLKQGVLKLKYRLSLDSFYFIIIKKIIRYDL